MRIDRAVRSWLRIPVHVPESSSTASLVDAIGDRLSFHGDAWSPHSNVINSRADLVSYADDHARRFPSSAAHRGSGLWQYPSDWQDRFHLLHQPDRPDLPHERGRWRAPATHQFRGDKLLCLALPGWTKDLFCFAQNRLVRNLLDGYRWKGSQSSNTRYRCRVCPRTFAKWRTHHICQ